MVDLIQVFLLIGHGRINMDDTLAKFVGDPIGSAKVIINDNRNPLWCVAWVLIFVI